MTAPVEYYGIFRVVIFKIMLGDFGIKPCSDISEILVFESVAVIFLMPADKNLPAGFGGHNVHQSNNGHWLAEGRFFPCDECRIRP